MDKIIRKTFTQQEIEGLKMEWHQSGLSKKKFTEQRGIKYYTFVGWFDKKTVEEKGFAAVKLPREETLFAEIMAGGKTIRFYQPFPPEYFSMLLK